MCQFSYKLGNKLTCHRLKDCTIYWNAFYLQRVNQISAALPVLKGHGAAIGLPSGDEMSTQKTRLHALSRRSCGWKTTPPMVSYQYRAGSLQYGTETSRTVTSSTAYQKLVARCLCFKVIQWTMPIVGSLTVQYAKWTRTELAAAVHSVSWNARRDFVRTTFLGPQVLCLHHPFIICTYRHVTNNCWWQAKIVVALLTSTSAS